MTHSFPTRRSAYRPYEFPADLCPFSTKRLAALLSRHTSLPSQPIPPLLVGFTPQGADERGGASEAIIDGPDRKAGRRAGAARRQGLARRPSDPPADWSGPTPPARAPRSERRHG